MPSVRVNKPVLKKWTGITLVSMLSTLLAFVIIDWCFPFKPKPDYSPVITAADSTVLCAFLNDEDKWRMNTELYEISPVLKKTILFKEDKYFYCHFGVNPVAVARALAKNMLRGEIVSGASTITMQLARLLDPRPRTYKSKIIEMFRAVQLEWHFSKAEILQLYLNHLPYGGNIEGVKAASLIYFDQTPLALSLAQVVTLSIIPNNPSSYQYRQEDPGLLRSRNQWLEFYDRKGIFDKQLILDATMEPLGIKRHEVPRHTPHLANRLHQMYPGCTHFHTYIDPELQSQIETVTWDHIRQVRAMGISNAAVLVIRNNTREVIGYVGSANFEDELTQGQVDGIRAVRSPGSTLKPFLYALAIDKGLITPATLLSDVPFQFGGYTPENYDGAYRGMISVKNALALSLNVPAVKLLNDLGEDFFINQLINARFRNIERKRNDLGLSVILGGCGTTLEELASLYLSMACQGTFKPIRFFDGQPERSPDSILSPAAAYLVTEMMTSLKRPDFPLKIEQVLEIPRIAWKTGTSYGRRDAWSIGFNSVYTVGVWVGNFQGHGVPELNGTDFAAPLLFKVFRILEAKGIRPWFDVPSGLTYRVVCSRSGLSPSNFCNDLVEDAYLPGISPSWKCQHIRPVFVNLDSSLSFCRSCLPSDGYQKKYYPNYPPEVIAFMNQQSIPYEAIPPHNPSCERIFYESSPKITSLTENAEYLLFRDEKQQLKLSCQVEIDVNKVSWFINNKFMTSSPVHEPVFFEPQEGILKISCVDDKGRNTDVWITVKYI